MDRYVEVVRTGKPAHFEEWFGPLDRWYEVTAYKTGEYQLAVIFSDITERRKAAEKINDLLDKVQREKDRLSSLVESIGDEVWFADTQKNFVLANPAALAEFALGYGAVDIEKFAASLEVYRPDGSPRPIEEAPPLRALKGEVVRNQEEMIRTPGHTQLRYRQVSSNPVKDAAGNIIGSVSVVRDITELKGAEKALQASEERLRLAQEAGNVGVWDWDLLTNDVRFTPELEAIYGRSPGSVRKYQDFQDQVYLDDLGMVETVRDEAVDKHKPFEFEFRILRPDGATIWIYCRGRAVYDDNGQAVRIFGINLDVTARKQAEEALKEYAENLRRSNEDLERFAYVASHDLREPLRMVTSFSQLLEKNYKGKLGQDADEFIQYIVEGGTRMDSLVNDLLEYSRVTSRTKPFEPTDMTAVVGEALHDLMISIRESKAKIHIDLLPIVSVDRRQAVQVIGNLVSNAIKFRGGDAPEIAIGAMKHGEEWVFSVKDNGIGIEPEYYTKIFQIFQRLHTREQYPGTGIGLALCRRIVERHGGRIWVESTVGKGSTFFFTIPAERNNSAGSHLHGQIND